ncbi:MAG: hypothetical protein ABSE69_05615 [Roseiarcus sp.]
MNTGAEALRCDPPPHAASASRLIVCTADSKQCIGIFQSPASGKSLALGARAASDRSRLEAVAGGHRPTGRDWPKAESLLWSKGNEKLIRHRPGAAETPANKSIQEAALERLTKVDAPW